MNKIIDILTDIIISMVIIIFAVLTCAYLAYWSSFDFTLLIASVALGVAVMNTVRE